MTDAPARTVHCKKLGRELPALEKPPFKTPLGVRIHEEISQEAWKQWKEHAKLILNEYRLNLALPEHQAMLMQQCEAFLFGEGGHVPKEFTPEAPAAGA